MQDNGISQSILYENAQYLERNGTIAPREQVFRQELNQEREKYQALERARADELQQFNQRVQSLQQELQLERDLRTSAESARAASEAEASRLRSQGVLLLPFLFHSIFVGLLLLIA